MKTKLKCFITCTMLLGFVLLISPHDRDKDQQPEKVMDVIGVTRGMVIGEIGAGNGYFVFKMAKRVGPQGMVYANEIKSSLLEDIRDECREKNIKNIRTVLGENNDPLFTEKKLDMAFMCYVLHDLTEPAPLLKNLKKYLKPHATLVVMDQEPSKTGSSHFLTKDNLLKLVIEAGYIHIQTETFLSKDNIYIFRMKHN